MSRRFGILLLLVVVASSSAASCPRSVMACSIAQQAAHDCCQQQATLRSADCCCKAAHQLTSQAVSTSAQHENGRVKPVATLLHAVLPLMDAAAQKTAQPPRHGPAPPDTPITQHTLLLL